MNNGGKLKLKVMSESSSPAGIGQKVASGAQVNKRVSNPMMNQYFMQKKHKFAQIDSPKDGSIERARQVDILQQESLRPAGSKTILIDDVPVLPLDSLKKKNAPAKVTTTDYII